MVDIEEIAPRAKEMACKKEMACCVRGYHVYKDVWAAAIGEVLVCSKEPPNTEKFSLQNYIRVKHFRTFSLYENSSQRNKSALRYALVSPLPSFTVSAGQSSTFFLLFDWVSQQAKLGRCGHHGASLSCFILYNLRMRRCLGCRFFWWRSLRTLWTGKGSWRSVVGTVTWFVAQQKSTLLPLVLIPVRRNSYIGWHNSNIITNLQFR